MKYCGIARQLLKKKVICGKDCPMLDDCFWIILQDGMDESVLKSMKAMLRILMNLKAGKYETK